MKKVTLTARDLALLDELAAHRAVPVEMLAERHFERNPFTNAVNTNPMVACERRLNSLAAAGFAMKFPSTDGARERVLIGLGPNAGGVLGRKADRRVPVSKLAHHARTLDALAEVEALIRGKGGRVVRSRVEQQVRSDAQRGRRVRFGDTFAPFPDAVLTAVLPGKERPVEIAIEYATSKYTDEDIRKKHEGFANEEYAAVFWVADRKSTQERVRRITGGRCSIVK